MSNQSEPKKQQSGSSEQPEQQDAVDMLVHWIGMAEELGMQIETFYNVSHGRLAVRVYGVDLEEDGSVVVKQAVPV